LIQRDVIKLLLIVGAVVWGSWELDKINERNHLILECVHRMTYLAAIQDGYSVGDDDGNNRNYELKKGKNGQTYVYAWASEPENIGITDLLNSLSPRTDTLNEESNTTAGSDENYEPELYHIRCTILKSNIFSITYVEKMSPEYQWVPMSTELLEIKDWLLRSNKTLNP